MLTFENIGQKCTPAFGSKDLLRSRFWFQPLHKKSKNSPPSAFDKSTIQIFTRPWEFKHLAFWIFDFIKFDQAKNARFCQISCDITIFSAWLVKRMRPRISLLQIWGFNKWEKFYLQLGFRLWERWPYLEVSAGKLLRLFSGKVRHIKQNQSHRIKNRKTKISSICSKHWFERALLLTTFWLLHGWTHHYSLCQKAPRLSPSSSSSSPEISNIIAITIINILTLIIVVVRVCVLSVGSYFRFRLFSIPFNICSLNVVIHQHFGADTVKVFIFIIRIDLDQDVFELFNTSA